MPRIFSTRYFPSRTSPSLTGAKLLTGGWFMGCFEEDGGAPRMMHQIGSRAYGTRPNGCHPNGDVRKGGTGRTVSSSRPLVSRLTSLGRGGHRRRAGRDARSDDHDARVRYVARVDPAVG